VDSHLSGSGVAAEFRLMRRYQSKDGSPLTFSLSEKLRLRRTGNFGVTMHFQVNMLYLVLHRMGFTWPISLPKLRCALTTPFHPFCTTPVANLVAIRQGKPINHTEVYFCCTIPGVASAGRYPASLPYGARTFLISLGLML